MSKAVKSRSRQLYLELRGQLESIQGGRRFYSQRKIMEQFRVTRHVADQALRLLTEAGMIEVRPREGIFVVRNQQLDRFRVVSFHCDWQSEQVRNFDQAVEKVLGEEPDRYAFSTVLYPFDGRDCIERLEAIRADAVLFYPPYGMKREELRRLLALPKTIVFCCNTLSYAGVDAVDLHPELIGMTAAHHLIRNGHRRLALLLSEPMSLAEHCRISSFLHLARLNGLEPAVIDCGVRSGDYSPTLVHAALSAHLEEHGADFTGIFVSSDTSALGALKALKDYGLNVPEDVSVIGNGGFAAGTLYTPPLTTVSENFAGFAAAVKAGVEALSAGGRFGLRSAPPLLIERQSVRNINP